jgi:hypothetical protein
LKAGPIEAGSTHGAFAHNSISIAHCAGKESEVGWASPGASPPIDESCPGHTSPIPKKARLSTFS